MKKRSEINLLVILIFIFAGLFFVYAYCGDATCEANEDCNNCSYDCGLCNPGYPPEENDNPPNTGSGGGSGSGGSTPRPINNITNFTRENVNKTTFEDITQKLGDIKDSIENLRDFNMYLYPLGGIFVLLLILLLFIIFKDEKLKMKIRKAEKYIRDKNMAEAAKIYDEIKVKYAKKILKSEKIKTRVLDLYNKILELNKK